VCWDAGGTHYDGSQLATATVMSGEFGEHGGNLDDIVLDLAILHVATGSFEGDLTLRNGSGAADTHIANGVFDLSYRARVTDGA